jgi:hypothetical protein
MVREVKKRLEEAFPPILQIEVKTGHPLFPSVVVIRHPGEDIEVAFRPELNEITGRLDGYQIGGHDAKTDDGVVSQLNPDDSHHVYTAIIAVRRAYSNLICRLGN